MSWPGDREVVEDDQVEDSTRNVDERIRLVGPAHQRGPLEKPLLHGRLNEQTKGLFGVDNLEAVFARGIDGGLLERDSREGSAELIDLHTLVTR